MTEHFTGIYLSKVFLLVGAVLVQALIGITTLLLVVPIGWALLHQLFGMVVLILAVAHARGLKGEYPRPAFAY